MWWIFRSEAAFYQRNLTLNYCDYISHGQACIEGMVRAGLYTRTLQKNVRRAGRLARFTSDESGMTCRQSAK